MMVRRARRGGEDFDYLLVDSWFMCSEAVRGLGRHVLGMLKSNINNFSIDGDTLKTGQMVSRFKKRRKRCRKYRCEYIAVDTDLCDTPVRLYLCRRTRQDGWKTILTTDTSLSFVQAYEIYAMRWSIEVSFKECKQYLRLEGNQAQYFNSQIAHVSICIMQYLLLSLAKRISSYETLGGLFRSTKADLVEITLYERILFVLKVSLRNSPSTSASRTRLLYKNSSLTMNCLKNYKLLTACVYAPNFTCQTLGDIVPPMVQMAPSAGLFVRNLSIVQSEHPKGV